MNQDRRGYKEQLLDPRWQRVRLRVFARDGWACVSCGGAIRTLHVHHLRYEAGQAPWESHPDTLATLCELCHRLVSPKARQVLMGELRLTQEQLREAAARVNEKLARWASQRRDLAQAGRPSQGGGAFASNCPNWRELRPRAGRVWTPDEDEALLLEFDAGLPLERIALLRGRGELGVAVRLCKLARAAPTVSRDAPLPSAD